MPKQTYCLHIRVHIMNRRETLGHFRQLRALDCAFLGVVVLLMH